MGQSPPSPVRPVPGAEFLSDNAAGVHPALLRAVVEANAGHAVPYGDDPWTRRAEETFRRVFGETARLFPVFNGTGANIVSLLPCVRPWEAVVTTDVSHVVTSESTASQLIGGMKPLVAPHEDGKLTPGALEAVFGGYDGSAHQARPAVVSVAETTELGTAYSPAELAELARCAHDHGALFHVDGSRLANAAAHLGVELRALTTDAGADVFSFGGTKNGMLVGDAVVVLDPALADGVERTRKAATQLGSKLRFVSAQLDVLVGTGLWRENAGRANAAAALLAARAETELGLTPLYPVQGDEVFLPVPADRQRRVVAAASVHEWGAGAVRAVASFDTTEADVAELIDRLARALA